MMLSFYSLKSQTKYLNQVKYWKYRYAFKEQFISIGSGEGKSIPGAIYDLENKEIQYHNTGNDLGWYLGLLATEYRILSSKMYLPITEYEELSPTQNLIELYRALKALQRLDASAEPIFACDSVPLNGFFVQRDTKPNLDSSGEIQSKGSIEPDIDQYLNIFLGLALVKKYIPLGTIVKGEDLNKLACDNAIRMFNYLEQNKWKIVHPCANTHANIFVHGEYNMRPYASDLKQLFYFFDSDSSRTIKIPFFKGKFWKFLRGNGKSDLSKRNKRLTSLMLSNSSGDKTGAKLKNLSLENNWLIYPLMNSLLYENQKEFEKDSLINMSERILDAASQMGIFGTNQGAWNSYNYFFTSEDQRSSGQIWAENKQFNGLDFMLFYNIWFIHRTGL